MRVRCNCEGFCSRLVIEIIAHSSIRHRYRRRVKRKRKPQPRHEHLLHVPQPRCWENFQVKAIPFLVVELDLDPSFRHQASRVWRRARSGGRPRATGRRPLRHALGVSVFWQIRARSRSGCLDPQWLREAADCAKLAWAEVWAAHPSVNPPPPSLNALRPTRR